MLCRIAIFASLIAFLVGAQDRVHAGAVRMALRPDVSISGDVILLTHLLSSPLPAALRAAASQVTLGSAPQLGTTRFLQRDALLPAFAQAGLDPSGFLIPDTITVHRAGRRLRAEEISSLVESYLTSRNASPGASQIGIEFSVSDDFVVPDGDLALYVKDAKYDAALRKGRLFVASRAFPELNPFAVTVAAESGALRVTPAFASSNKTKEGPPLVTPGRRAQMTMDSKNAHMILAVVPLEKGFDGQAIRVRVANTSKYLNARVVAQDTLEAIY